MLARLQCRPRPPLRRSRRIESPREPGGDGGMERIEYVHGVGKVDRVPRSIIAIDGGWQTQHLPARRGGNAGAPAGPDPAEPAPDAGSAYFASSIFLRLSNPP